MITRTETYAKCPDCNSRLQECQDDEDERRYYECFACGGEYTLDGFPRPQGYQECRCGSDKSGNTQPFWVVPGKRQREGRVI